MVLFNKNYLIIKNFIKNDLLSLVENSILLILYVVMLLIQRKGWPFIYLFNNLHGIVTFKSIALLFYSQI